MRFQDFSRLIGVFQGVFLGGIRVSNVVDHLTIKNAVPREKAYKPYDGKGLYLLVTPQGGKLWRYKYSLAGREKMLCLGQYPALNLKDARQRKREEKATFRILAEE
jgi:hypothetical protein